MKALRALALVAFLPVAAAAAPTPPAKTAPKPKAPVVDMSAAPADDYFGPQKMSALGIRMRIDSLGRRYHARTLSDVDLLHDAAIAEGAVRVWNSRYPRDPWLAPTAFHLAQLYAEIPSADGRAHAATMLRFVGDTFAATRYGHLSRLRLAQGFPPLPAEAAASGAPASPEASSPVSASGTGSPESPVPSGATPATSATAGH
jgi:hypothetical protein